jgi:D-alanyl-lipoteichoic acid acyltransferase DltB (MBOAT superfamily)
MQFITTEFFVFFLIVLFPAIFLKKFNRLYTLYLLIAGLVFYYFFGLNGLIILLVNLLINFLLLKLLSIVENSFLRKLLLFISVLTNIVFLGYFKYTNFIGDTLSDVLNANKINGINFDIEIFAPVGISFYTFRVISHLVDVYRKQVEVKSVFHYALYVTFFPQILSGPIMKAREFYEGLSNVNIYEYSDARIIILVLGGLIKKLVIASYLWDFTQGAFSTPQSYSSIDLIIASIAYACLIYTDFSGYSDISIALSNLLGFPVNKNFNMPYRAIGLKDFWSRWHISLSSWLKDYVYIPLGGSRHGKFIKYLNLLIVMFVSGLWHGAGLTFIVWGLLHGFGSIVSHIIEDLVSLIKKINLDKVRKYYIFDFFIFIIKNISYVTGWAMTFIFVNITWIFFNSKSLDSAINYISGVINSNISNVTLFNYTLFSVIAIVLVFNFIGNIFVKYSELVLLRLRLWVKLILIVLLVYVILSLGPDIVPPFIYFNF